MKPENQTSNNSPWTWADQISSYNYWGLFLFLIFTLIPSMILRTSFGIFVSEIGLGSEKYGLAMSCMSYASLGGLWFVWFIVRLKNHYLLFILSLLTIIGLLIMYFLPSFIPICIGLFLVGLGTGVIFLAIASIVAGGRGGSEMFVVSVGLIIFFETTAWLFFPMLSGFIQDSFAFRGSIIFALISACIGAILLIPVKAQLFYGEPPKRKFSFTPIFREPIVIVLLCLIPLYNIYYLIHLSYRFHGEINSICPTQKILSPRSAAWCTILLPVLSPIIAASLNGILTSEFTERGKTKFYKNCIVILWSIISLPICFALIQSNMNKIIAKL